MHEGQNCSPKHQSLIATTITIHISVQDKKKLNMFIFIFHANTLFILKVSIYIHLYTSFFHLIKC